jgi:hypothetical protein
MHHAGTFVCIMPGTLCAAMTGDVFVMWNKYRPEPFGSHRFGNASTNAASLIALYERGPDACQLPPQVLRAAKSIFVFLSHWCGVEIVDDRIC